MQRPTFFSSRQQGSVLLQFALLLGVIVSILGVVDLGYLFYAKRELQRNADLSALHAVQSIDFNVPNGSQRASRCEQAGLQSVDANWPASSPITPLLKSTTCGEWDAGLYSAPEHFQPNAANVNAARVVLEGRSPAFFPGPWSRVITAQAVAKRGAPLATVLIRSTLASLDGGMLNVLLGAVLGSQISVDAASWKGIAQLNVNLLQMFGSLLQMNTSIGSYEELLNAQVKLSDVLQAMLTAVEPGTVTDADIAALRQIALLNFGNVQVRLGDLIKLENIDPSAALNLGISALELLQGALQVAAKNHALDLNLGIPGLLTVKSKIIEPAQLAVIGNPLNTSVVIEARTAQVRVWAALDTQATPSSSILKSVLDLVVNLLKLVLSILINVEVLPEFRNLNQLKLDVLVDVARGYARIEDVECQQVPNVMNMKVEKAGVDVYVGKMSGTTLVQREQQAFGASIPQVTPLTIIDLGSRVCVLGICGPRTEGSQGSIRLGGHLKLLSEQSPVRFNGDEINQFQLLTSSDEPRIYHKVLPKNISSISGALQGANLIEVNISNGSAVGEEQKKGLVSSLLQNVLDPVLKILDPLAPLLDGLLRALGIQLNGIEVAPYLQCGGSSELVY